MGRPCWDYTGDGIRESVRQSLERLKLKKLTCLRRHDCETEERFTQFTTQGGMDAMIAFKQDGTVGELSLGMNDHTFILRLIQKYPNTVDSIMLAGCFNLIDNHAIDL